MEACYIWRWPLVDVLERLMFEFGGLFVMRVGYIWRWFLVDDDLVALLDVLEALLHWLMTWRLCYIGWWLGGLLLEIGGWLGGLTFDLVYILSWILRGLSTCLDYAWELVVTRIDDVAVLDDDQMDGWAVDVEVLLYILLASWSLLPLRVGFLKTTLGWNQETQAGSCTKSWCSSYQLVLRKIYEDRDLPHHHNLLYEWFLSMNIYYWVFHSYLVPFVYMVDLLLLCIDD